MSEQTTTDALGVLREKLADLAHKEDCGCDNRGMHMFDGAWYRTADKAIELFRPMLVANELEIADLKTEVARLQRIVGSDASEMVALQAEMEQLRAALQETGRVLQRSAYTDKDLLQARMEIVELRGMAPLRRLVWRVIPADRSFSVAEVAEGLVALGVPKPSSRNEISNALGYWVRRGRLERCSKGVYRDRNASASAEGGAAS
jgi:regulator of replication initiation timing